MLSICKKFIGGEKWSSAYAQSSSGVKSGICSAYAGLTPAELFFTPAELEPTAARPDRRTKNRAKGSTFLWSLSQRVQRHQSDQDQQHCHQKFHNLVWIRTEHVHDLSVICVGPYVDETSKPLTERKGAELFCASLALLPTKVR